MLTELSSCRHDRDVKRLIELAEAVIKSADSGLPFHAYVDRQALNELEDWIVNRFGEN